MQNQRINRWIPICAAAAIVLAAPSASWAQEPRPDEEGEAERLHESEWEIMDRNKIRHAAMQKAKEEAAKAYKHIMVAHGMPEAMHGIRESAEKLRDAEPGQQREEARQKLASLLDEYFERDMERRLGELQELERRVAKLREQLERRGSKKEDIIDLQIQVLENEADGLGFFGNGAPHAWTIPGPQVGFQFAPKAAVAAPPVGPADVYGAPPAAPFKLEARPPREPRGPARARGRSRESEPR